MNSSSNDETDMYSSLSDETENEPDLENSPSSTTESTGSDIDDLSPPSISRRSDKLPFVESIRTGFNYDPAAGILQFFEAYFDDDLVNYICAETNRFGSQGSVSRPSSSRRASRDDWKKIAGPELRIFLMLYTLQTIIKMPEKEFHWSTRNILHCPFFGKTMALNRYNAIKKNLLFSNNATYNLWSIHEKLEEKFTKLFPTDKNAAIDESFLVYKENIGWKQCVLSKRARFGVKLYALCESKSGYIWKSIIYTGKGTRYDSDFDQHCMSEQVVTSLMKPLLEKGYCLTSDNIYTTPNLSELLVSRKTDTYGNVGKTRRYMPPNLKTIAYKKSKPIVLIRKNGKDAMLSSTVEIEKRNKTRTKPKDCNNTTDGVDYPIAERYYKKIFFNLYDLALWNSYILFKKSGGKSTYLNYRLDVIEQSVDKYIPLVTSIPRRRPPADTHPRRITERHFIEEIPSTEKQTHPRRGCHLCSKKRDASGKKIRKDTKFHCPDCNVPLCPPCFKIYHTTV